MTLTEVTSAAQDAEAEQRPRVAAASTSEPFATIEAGPPVLETGGVLTIDLAAIVANWKDLAARVAPAECSAAVKADAYGCGLAQVTHALARAGCRTFFVAHIAEARVVREVAPAAVIYVLNGIPPAGAAAVAEAGARPVLGSMPELVEWDAYCRVTGWTGGAALHFDTGMNRLGFPLDAASALSARMDTPNHGITLVMSHFACADVPDHPLNNLQLQRFRDLRLMFRGIDASLANSSGIFLGPATHFDLVRPGVSLYGLNPTPHTSNPMRPVVQLDARVVQIRQVAKGETVGYGGAWTAPRHSRIAIVAVGYGDGFLRAGAALGERAPEVLVVGKRCPIVGRISMDLMAIDVTALPAASPRRGDYVSLIGGEIRIDELAPIAGSIGYELLTSLGRRYHRTWRE